MSQPDIPRRIQVEWAKEMMLHVIDQQLFDTPSEYTEALDEEVELLKQRNRIARFLGLPERKL